MIVTKEDLYRVPIPSQTRTYKPIKNSDLINTAIEIISSNGYHIKDETYKANGYMKQMTRVLSLASEDTEVGMALGLINSYDKSRRVGAISGSTVWICTNGMFNSEFSEIRKHTGNVQDDIEDMISGQILNMQKKHEDLIVFREQIKPFMVTRNDVAHLLGEMYLDGIILPTQLSIIKKEMTKDTKGILGERVSLWRFYNWVTKSLKTSHTSNLFAAHTIFHKYIEDKFKSYIDVEYSYV